MSIIFVVASSFRKAVDDGSIDELAIFPFHIASLRRNTEITWMLSDLHYAPLMDFIVISHQLDVTRAIFDWLPFEKPPHNFVIFCLSPEFIDVWTVVHHLEVNHEASNWSCTNLLPNTVDHHLGESRSRGDSRAGFRYSGAKKSLSTYIHFYPPFLSPLLDALRVREVSNRQEKSTPAFAGNLNWIVIMKSCVKHLKSGEKTKRAAKQLPLLSPAIVGAFDAVQQHKKLLATILSSQLI